MRMLVAIYRVKNKDLRWLTEGIKDMSAYVAIVFTDWLGNLHDMVLWRGKLSESFF